MNKKRKNKQGTESGVRVTINSGIVTVGFTLCPPDEGIYIDADGGVFVWRRIRRKATRKAKKTTR